MKYEPLPTNETFSDDLSSDEIDRELDLEILKRCHSDQLPVTPQRPIYHRSVASIIKHILDECWLLFCLALKLWSYLGIGWKWFYNFNRLLLYATFLLPGFIQMIAFYYFSPRVIRSIAYGLKARQRLDLYLPKNMKLSERYPVVIYITGGAWTIGYKAWGALLGRRLSRHGVLVACLDYRNFPQGDVVQMLEDINTGITWILAHAPRHQGDVDRVALVGQSAGAHLAAYAVLAQAEASVEETCTAWLKNTSNLKMAPAASLVSSSSLSFSSLPSASISSSASFASSFFTPAASPTPVVTAATMVMAESHGSISSAVNCPSSFLSFPPLSPSPSSPPKAAISFMHASMLKSSQSSPSSPSPPPPAKSGAAKAGFEKQSKSKVTSPPKGLGGGGEKGGSLQLQNPSHSVQSPCRLFQSPSQSHHPVCHHSSPDYHNSPFQSLDSSLAPQGVSPTLTPGTYPRWCPSQLVAFVGVSGAYDLEGLSDHLHRRGLYKNLFRRIISIDGKPALREMSPLEAAHRLLEGRRWRGGVTGGGRVREQKLRERRAMKPGGEEQELDGDDDGDDELTKIQWREMTRSEVRKKLPSQVLLMHGTADNSVPYEGSVKLDLAFKSLGAHSHCLLFPKFTHTSFLLESPMEGGRDVLSDSVLWMVRGGALCPPTSLGGGGVRSGEGEKGKREGEKGQGKGEKGQQDGEKRQHEEQKRQNEEQKRQNEEQKRQNEEEKGIKGKIFENFKSSSNNNHNYNRNHLYPSSPAVFSSVSASPPNNSFFSNKQEYRLQTPRATVRAGNTLAVGLTLNGLMVGESEMTNGQLPAPPLSPPPAPPMAPSLSSSSSCLCDRDPKSSDGAESQEADPKCRTQKCRTPSEMQEVVKGMIVGEASETTATVVQQSLEKGIQIQITSTASLTHVLDQGLSVLAGSSFDGGLGFGFHYTPLCPKGLCRLAQWVCPF